MATEGTLPADGQGLETLVEEIRSRLRTARGELKGSSDKLQSQRTRLARAADKVIVESRHAAVAEWLGDDQVLAVADATVEAVCLIPLEWMGMDVVAGDAEIGLGLPCPPMIAFQREY